MPATFKIKDAALLAPTFQPWREVPFQNPIPSMISAEEFGFFEWCARFWYRGEGEIVDLGPLGGGSTLAFGRGLSANAHVSLKTKRIHSYDLWLLLNNELRSFFPGYELQIGEPVFDIFQKNVAPYAASRCWRPRTS